MFDFSFIKGYIVQFLSKIVLTALSGWLAANSITVDGVKWEEAVPSIIGFVVAFFWQKFLHEKALAAVPPPDLINKPK